MTTTDNPAVRFGAAPASTTSSSLLDRVQNNDAESWHRIVSLYAPLVLWWCRKKWRLPDEDAHDVIPAVFTTVFAKINSFAKDRRPGAFRRWLYSITKNKVRDILRRIRNEPRAHGGSSALELLAQVPAEDFESDEDSEQRLSEKGLIVRRALELIRQRFEPRTWDVVWEIVVEGRCAQDVAKKFEMKAGAVHKAKSVVLRRLRETLLEYEEFEEFLN